MDWRLLTKVGVGGFMNYFTCEKELSSILVVLRTLRNACICCGSCCLGHKWNKTVLQDVLWTEVKS